MQVEPQVHLVMQVELRVKARLVMQPELVVQVQLEVELLGEEQVQAAPSAG